MTRPSITDVHEQYAEAWQQLDGVLGTGIGRCEGKPCIKVMVRSRSPALEDTIPEEVDGYPVRIEVTGVFRAREDTTGAE